MNDVVVAENVRKRYGDTVALAGLTLSVERGEVFGLLGPNGAGKTTLVRTLTGTSRPDSGTVSVCGEEPTAVDRDRIAVLPQAFSPPGRLTARELLAYYAGLYDDAREPGDVLADVGLADVGETWYENLSGGQRRRVCVGTALVNDPEVLFLDEPTTGIDPAGRRTIWRLIEGLAAGGTTVVLTTHDMSEAERLADRVGLLEAGRLIARGTPSALVDEHGGSSRLTVETDAGPSALEGVGYPTETRAGAVVVRNVSPGEIGTVVEFLDAADVEYTGLSWAEPDLEDVYLTLAEETELEGTGRTDGADAAGGGDEPSTSGTPTSVHAGGES